MWAAWAAHVSGGIFVLQEGFWSADLIYGGCQGGHRESQVSPRSFAWGRKSWSCSLESLVPMQQRRDPMSLGGVAGSQLRMYLGFDVLFPGNIQEWGAQIPLIFHGVPLGPSAFLSPWRHRRLNRSDLGSCKSFVSTTQMFRIRWSSTIPRTEFAWWVFRWEPDRFTTKPSICLHCLEVTW